MNIVKSYRDLEVWKKSIEWAELIYKSSSGFPAEERFGLKSQLRRAAVSVASNIAEGAERRTTGEYLHSLSIARGSLAEAETQIILARRLEFFSQDQEEPLLLRSEELSKMLGGLMRSLESRR